MDPADPFIVDLEDPADVAAKIKYARAEQSRAQHAADLWGARAVALEAPAEPGVRRRVMGPDGEISWIGSDEALRDAGSVQVRKLVDDQKARAAHAVKEWALEHAETDIGDVVVEIVNAEGRGLRAEEVHDILVEHGFAFTQQQVSTALHYAATGTHPARITSANAPSVYGPLPSAA